AKKNGVSVRAYKGDAMTLLCFDVDKKIIENFTGFSIKVTPPGENARAYYLYNRICYAPGVIAASKLDPAKINIYKMNYAPLQRFSWVHVPGTDSEIQEYIYGNYKFDITPRYLIDNKLQALNKDLTVSVTIDVSPYQSGKTQISFTRGFIESQAYSRHFGLNNKIRPNDTDLIYNTNQIANSTFGQYTFEDQYNWLGWQARVTLFDFLDETLNNKKMSLDVFAYDLDEPDVCSRLIELARQGRVRIILDNSASHTGDTAFETKFDSLFKQEALDKTALVRGKYLSISHSKIFIQKYDGKPVKVLTGSANFSTNGLYINANHVIVFQNMKVAQAYDDVFNASFGTSDADTVVKMKAFKTGPAQAAAFEFENISSIPDMAIRFSPHNKDVATVFFDLISQRILNAQSDVLFAVMNDRSASSILDALHTQVKSENVFTYGITDVIADKQNGVMLYKPDSKRGVLVAGKPGEYILPEPFEEEAKTPGISVHHKFVVVDFKGANPVVYCGSSNLAFGPEQSNGDNLLEIRNRNAVTVFAIEAMRLVDHFEWRNALAIKGTQPPVMPAAGTPPNTFYLHGSTESNWVNKYYDPNDLRCVEKELLIRPHLSA
ncbi:MAG TPA: phospholipase D-like domain-containing protein, partial [Ginsengibacter sp.]